MDARKQKTLYRGVFYALLRKFVSGTRRSIVEEPLAWAEEYSMQWREPQFNLAELAVLRWIEGSSTKELAERFGRSMGSIENHYRALRRKDFSVPGLSDLDREEIRRIDGGCGLKKRQTNKPP